MRDFHLPGRSAVFATNGLCATSHPIAAQLAVTTLQRGGNALDAALAGAMILGLAEPQMTGVGGDCFALIAKPGADVVAVNGSGRAPQQANASALRQAGLTTMPPHDARAVTIPGAIDAFCTMAQRWGRLGLEDSLMPVVPYMEQGLPVAPRVAFDWQKDASVLQGSARRDFLLNGHVPNVGEVFALPKQAELIKRIAKQGRSAFYEGEAMEDMLATLTQMGGAHQADDFAKTRCTISAPVSGQYKDQELLEHPPNGQGIIAHLLLNILSHFDLPALDPFGADRTHIEAEAAKLAYAARDNLLADPDYMAGYESLLSQETAARLAGQIDLKRTLPYPLPPESQVHKDTIYITVVDRDRMAVSLIYSIFHGFGSGISSDKFSVLFQNRGAGFSLAPGHPNELLGGKRPMHTIIPAILRQNGQTMMPFGVMGGQYQPNGHARLVTNMVDYGMDPQAALDAPRSFAYEGALRLERGYQEAVRAELAERGHKIETPDTPIGGGQAIVIKENGVLIGASDPRKDGCAIGY